MVDATCSGSGEGRADGRRTHARGGEAVAACLQVAASARRAAAARVGGWRSPRTSSTGSSTRRAGARLARNAARASPRTRSGWPSWCRCEREGRFVRGGASRPGSVGGGLAWRSGTSRPRGAPSGPVGAAAPDLLEGFLTDLERKAQEIDLGGGGAFCFVKMRNRFC